MKGSWVPLLFCFFLVTACNRVGKVAAKIPRPANLAPVTATASVDKALISTEDAVTFSVVIDRERALEVPIPDIGSLIKGFRITDFGTEDKDEDKRKITRKWFSLRADVAGSYILPEVEVHYSEAGKEKSAKTSEIFVEVQAPAAAGSEAQQDIRDIKAIEKTPSHLLAWLGGALAVIGVTALGMYLFKKRKRKGNERQRLPAHEEALNRIQELEIPSGENSEALKRYYFLLSEIIRSYAENKYGFPATDMTSEEIVRALRTNSLISEDQKLRFIEFLKESDIVKFTDFYPPRETIPLAKDRVRDFVLQTQPVVETTPESVV
jgi:hypothetical protein